MENPIKYSDFIGPDNSVTDLIKQLEELLSIYTKMSKDLKKEAVDLEKAIKKTSTTTAETQETVRKAASDADRLKRAQEELNRSYGKTAEQLADLKRQQRDANNVNKLIAQYNSSLEGSYDRLSAQYGINKIALNAMTAEQRKTTVEGQKLEKQTREIYEEMVRLQAATGKHTLSVGNYKKSWDGLGFSVNQLARELPSLAISMQTFFLAISNNFPMFIDEINKLRAANKKAVADGKAAVPVIGSITKALFSWNTLIVLLISGLTIFGKEIGDWIKTMIKGNKEVDRGKQILKNYNAAIREGQKDAAKDITSLRILYRASQDLSISLSDRREIVERLKDMFPDYLKGISDEEILAGKATKAYDELVRSLYASARARAMANQIVKNEEKRLELDEKKVEIEEKMQEALKNTAIAQGVVNMTATGAFNAVNKGIDNLLVNKYRKELADIAKQSVTLILANEKLENSINAVDLAFTPKKKVRKEAKDRTEQITRENLEIQSRYQESQNELLDDGLEKRRKMLLADFEKEKNELLNKQKNDKDLTEESRETINAIIVNMEKKLQKDIRDLQIDDQIKQLQIQAETLKLRLEATKEGSIEEHQYRMLLLENARKQELLANSKLAISMQQSVTHINDRYYRQRLDQDNKFWYDRTMLFFDRGQALAETEFNSIRRSEGEKTRFKLQAEKERWEKILQLANQGMVEMTDIEKQTVQNTINNLTGEIKKSAARDIDLYSLVGLRLDDEQKSLIDESTQFAIGQVNDFLQAKVEAAQVAVDAANKEVEAAKSRLDAEIEARNNGYAFNTTLAQKELDQARKNQQKALADQAKAQKAQAAIETLTQTSSLVTASAKILATIPFPFSIAAIALMWSTFAAAKIKAAQVTRQKADAETYGEGGLEILEGGSHASGKDIALGTTRTGKSRRAEGGEAMAIINKRKTRKYKSILPDIVESLNKGTFEKMFSKAYDAGGMSLNMVQNQSDLRLLESDVKAIRRQGESRSYIDGKGRTVVIYKNLKRVYNAN